MSRFSGRQGPDAARGLRAERRAEAEQRQAAEAARDRARAALHPDPPDLTGTELAELLLAAFFLNDRTRPNRQPERPTP